MARKRPRDVISVLSDDEVHFTTTSGAIDLTSDDDGDAAARPAAAIDRLAELLERQNDTQRERDLRREREHRLQCAQIRGSRCRGGGCKRRECGAGTYGGTYGRRTRRS